MKEIVVDVGTNQTQVALMENNELVEIYIERHSRERITGNIYKGKVENVLPGMQAAFIDVGLDKNVFLYVKDALPNTYFDEEDENTDGSQYKDYKITDLLKTGQEIMVQITKEPIDQKGARVTTHITLPGRYLVLMPTVEYVGVSRRIEKDEERERLKKIAENIKPKAMGLIIRTAAEGCTEEDLQADVGFLTKLWESVRQTQKSGEIPRIVHKDLDMVCRTVRDMFTKDIDKFVINGKEQFEKVQELVGWISPRLKDRVEFYDKIYDIFEYYQVDKKLTKALNRKVWLKSGGYIVIDQTEALTVIDVNTGKFVGSKNLQDTVLKINIEAAVEIAKQLRLRDIGGIIVIDFIDMSDKDHEKTLIDALKNALKKDRTRTNVLGMTQLGLLEMTRKKVRQRIESVLLSPCPYCDGEGKILSDEKISHDIEKEIKKALDDPESRGVYIEAHPEIEKTLAGAEGSRLKKLQNTDSKAIYTKAEPLLHREKYIVKALDREEVKEMSKS